VPRGSVFYIASATTPDGYLRCNGQVIPTSGSFQAVSASLLQDLRTLLSTTYGADGQLPNLENRFVGYSATPGATGGSATVTLTEAQMPEHNHGAANSTDRVVRTTGSVDGFPNLGGQFGGGTAQLSLSNTVGGGGDTNKGSSQAHENLPPYLGMRPIIKY